MSRHEATHLFIIDTDQYSGGFHRELAAYITGRWDLATHGGVQAAIADLELTKEQRAYFESHNVELHRKVDDGCQDVNHVIWPTPGWYNDGHGTHVEGEPGPDELKKCFQEKLWPAYQGVAIFFNALPPHEILKVMMERAEKFTEYWMTRPVPWASKTKIKILGFRIILETVETREIVL